MYAFSRRRYGLQWYLACRAFYPEVSVVVRRQRLLAVLVVKWYSSNAACAEGQQQSRRPHCSAGRSSTGAAGLEKNELLCCGGRKDRSNRRRTPSLHGPRAALSQASTRSLESGVEQGTSKQVHGSCRWESVRAMRIRAQCPQRNTLDRQLQRGMSPPPDLREFECSVPIVCTRGRTGARRRLGAVHLKCNSGAANGQEWVQ